MSTPSCTSHPVARTRFAATSSARKSPDRLLLPRRQPPTVNCTMNSPRSILLFLLLMPALATQLGGGCTSSSTTTEGEVRDIPNDAREVREGPGQLSYYARRDGRIYAYDVQDH